MAELSIIEFIIYGLVGYPALIMLISSAFRETPSTKSGATIRAIWILPAIIMMWTLASAGAQIDFTTVQTINTITDNATQTVVFTEDVMETTTINLVQPVWIAIHGLFAIMLVLYFIWNMLQLFTKRE